MGLLIGCVLAAAARLRVPVEARVPVLQPALAFGGGAFAIPGAVAASGDGERRGDGGGAHSRRPSEEPLHRRRNALLLQEQRIQERERALAERRAELEWLRSEIERMRIAHDEREERLSRLEQAFADRFAGSAGSGEGAGPAPPPRIADEGSTSGSAQPSRRSPSARRG